MRQDNLCDSDTSDRRFIIHRLTLHWNAAVLVFTIASWRKYLNRRIKDPIFGALPGAGSIRNERKYIILSYEL